MSRRYHCNPTTGNVGLCRASEGKCPFGGEAEHYSSPSGAARAYEEQAERDSTYLASQSRGTKHEELWQILRIRALQDLTAEFDEAYAAATLRFMDELKKDYPVEWGRTRVVFLKGDLAIKIPLNGEGMGDSSLESRTSEAYVKNPDSYIPMARTELRENHEGVGYALAERVAPFVGALSDSSIPDWVGSVDCGQVGYTKAGKLVAYDL